MVDTARIEQLMHTYFEDAYSEARITPGDYVIDQSGHVHVNTHIHMFKATPNRMLPVQLALVDGDCMLAERALKSLKGAPHTVRGDFDCSMNALTSLQHAPRNMGPGASFQCDGNQLTSLAHAPAHSHELVCNNNLLTDLSDAPPCLLLWATENPFQTFRNTPDHIRTVVISYAPDLPLLGLLSVHRIEFQHDLNPWEAQSRQVEEILNRHTQQGRAGQIKCAAELIRSGFKGNARL